MINFIPKIGHWVCDCPIHNGEYGHCQITQSNCPKATEIDGGDYSMDYPDDCPAKNGIIVRTEEAVKNG